MNSRTPLFARTGFTSPLGKAMYSLGTLRLRPQTRELVIAAATRQGLPVMEYVREVLEIGHHGRSEVERLHTIRLDALEQVQPKRNGTSSTE